MTRRGVKIFERVLRRLGFEEAEPSSFHQLSWSVTVYDSLSARTTPDAVTSKLRILHEFTHPFGMAFSMSEGLRLVESPSEKNTKLHEVFLVFSFVGPSCPSWKTYRTELTTADLVYLGRLECFLS
jgi:hypothetical protein